MLELQRDQLQPHGGIGGGRAHHRPIVVRGCGQQILGARLVDAIVVGGLQLLILRAVQQTWRGLFNGLLLVVVNAAGGQEDVMPRVFQKKLVIVGKGIFTIVGYNVCKEKG